MELEIFNNNFYNTENDVNVKSIYDEIIEVNPNSFVIEYEIMSQEYAIHNLNPKEIVSLDDFVDDNTKEIIDMIKVISISFSLSDDNIKNYDCMKKKLNFTTNFNNRFNFTKEILNKPRFANNIKCVCKYYSKWKRKSKPYISSTYMIDGYIYDL